MKTKFLLAFLSVFGHLSDAKSQDIKPSKNSFFLELLGNGGAYSVNYERSLTSNIYGRLGFGSWTSTQWAYDYDTKLTTFPVLVTYISGQAKHHFEAGAGLLLGSIKEEFTGPDFIFDFTSFLGYRYQKPGKSLLFRAGLTPFISLNETNYPDKIMLSGGISLGYHF